MLLCDNCNGGYHLFCFKSELTYVPIGIWYCLSCSFATPWFLLKPCHAFLGLGLGGDTWEFHLSLLLCIVYICACISFWLISFYLWLVLVFLFSRVYYGFTPLRHQTSQHYTSRQLPCRYAWLRTWRLVTGMLIMPLGLMDVLKILYAIRCFRVMARLRFQLCWWLHKKLSFSFLLSIFLEFLYQGEFPP